MIEQEITRLVNQSERKGRFIIQELDDEVNNLEKLEVSPNNVEKYFFKRTKHSSICNNNKIIHLLYNQSENPNNNSEFSTFIFEENSKDWVDFNSIWSKFSKIHCDISENNMEKIFNYTDIKLEDHSDYFNDSCHIYNNINNIQNQQFFNEKPGKNNTNNENFTNFQTTYDASHINIAESGVFNITTQDKKINNIEINENYPDLNYSRNQNLNNDNVINYFSNNKTIESDEIKNQNLIKENKLITLKKNQILKISENSPSRQKNLNINFNEKRLIVSPEFSPINSDYEEKDDKININLNHSNNFNKDFSNTLSKSKNKFIFFEDYFKEEKKRQKRLFSEFKSHNNKPELINYMICPINNFTILSVGKKSKTKKNFNNKKNKKKSNLNVIFQIENSELEIKKFNDPKQENYLYLKQTEEISITRNKYICNSCGKK